MALRTHGEYIAPVDEFIDRVFPEGAEVTIQDLKIVAAYAVATVLDLKNQGVEAKAK